jgi:hypothetical protein
MVMCRGFSPCSRFEALGVLMEPTLEGFLYGSVRADVLRKKNTTALLFIFYARITPKCFSYDVAGGYARFDRLTQVIECASDLPST